MFSIALSFIIDPRQINHGEKRDDLLPLGIRVAVLLGIGMMTVPRSPRWLFYKGREEEAYHALAYIRGLDVDSIQVTQEIQGIILQKLNGLGYRSANSKSSSWSHVFSPQIIPRLLVGVPFILFQQFTGQNTINYFAPVIFKDLGITGRSSDLFATVMVAFDSKIRIRDSLGL